MYDEMVKIGWYREFSRPYNRQQNKGTFFVFWRTEPNKFTIFR